MMRQNNLKCNCFIVPIQAVEDLACILSEPGEIVTTALGLRSRSITWEGAAARYVPALREVLVIGQDGTAITHSK
jgi:hypothetical protein